MSASDLEKRARLRIGQMYDGKWHLAHLLGVGGTAAVYAARHRNASTAAVKILHPTIAHDDILRARFLREGYVANTVAHPGAVRVLDDDTADDGSVYLVMELLEGEELDSRARRKGGKLPVDEVLSITDQLLDVLRAAHAKGILHRDIKPENLFLTLDGQLKVLDFGIARLGDAASSATITGTALGTPAFMAPEMALGKSDIVGPRTDLWAVGATMFNLLTARYVQNGDSANEVLVRAATTRVVAIQRVCPDVPDEIASIVDRALAFEPDARFQDAASFQEAVRRAYYAIQGQPSGGPPPLPRMTAEEIGPDLDEKTLVDRLGGAGPVSGDVPEEKTTLLVHSRSERPPGTSTHHSLSSTADQQRKAPWPLVIGVVAAAALLVFVVAFVARGRASTPSVATPARSVAGPIVAMSAAPTSSRSPVADEADAGVTATPPVASAEPKTAPTDREPKGDKDPKHRPPQRFVVPPLNKPDF